MDQNRLHRQIDGHTGGHPYIPPPLKNMFAGAIHMFFVFPKDQDLENEKSGKKVITV